MENATTTNFFLVDIQDTKNGGSIGIVWKMSNIEIDNFNRDNSKAGLKAVIIDK